jgi:hypothetical protein
MMRSLLVAFTCAFALISTPIFTMTAVADDTAEDIVIRNDGDKTFYEYRRGGQIVEIKVVPKYGKPYYLTPADVKNEETGSYIQSDAPEISAPTWFIFRW